MFSWFEDRLNPFPNEEPTQPPQGLVAFCWHYAKPAGPWLFLMSAITALISIGEVYLFGFLGNIVDWLAASEQGGFLEREGSKLIWMGAVLLIGLPTIVLLQSLLVHQTLLGNFPMIARWQMHRYLLRQSVGFFANEFAGRVATKVMQTSLSIRESVMKLLDVFVYVSVNFVSMVVLIALADWVLALPLLLWVIVYITLIRYFVPRLKKVSSDQADARSSMTGRVVDSYTNITTVKLFSHAGGEAAYAKESMEGFLVTVHQQMRMFTQFQFAVYFNNVCLVFAVSALAIWLWLGSVVSVGSIAISIALCLRINGMSQWIMWEVSSLFENIGVVHDGMTMMVKPHEVVDQPKAQPLDVPLGQIEFEHVSFHYGKASGVIDDFSLKIKSGEKIGLVGRSGAGKTTLMNLLLRFYDLERGRVLIDEQDIAQMTQESLRSCIGVVTQDTSLLHRSIRENIGYSAPESTDKQVIEAARKANAWDFIQELEDSTGRKGLDAHVGERGVKLSGGQRQRIAIARVLVLDPKLLICDEPTSSLDVTVQKQVLDLLIDIQDRRHISYLFISHDINLVSSIADKISVMYQGKIVESGKT